MCNFWRCCSSDVVFDPMKSHEIFQVPTPLGSLFRLQDGFNPKFNAPKDCASVQIYVAYLFYLITASIIFILYVLVFTIYQQVTVRKTGKWESEAKVVENDKVCKIVCEEKARISFRVLVSSFLQGFAPAIVRLAVVLFGLCYIACLTAETIARWGYECSCWQLRNYVINFVNIAFVVMQGFLIVYYPRLTLHINGYIDRCMLNQSVVGIDYVTHTR